MIQRQSRCLAVVTQPLMLIGLTFMTFAGMGCRTTGSSAVNEAEVADESGTYCAFAPARGYGEQQEVWVGSITGNSLQNVRTRYTAGGAGAEVSRAISALGTVVGVDTQSITDNDQLVTRTYFKTEIEINWSEYNCINLDATAAGLTRRNFFCLALQPGKTSAQRGLWVTNASHFKFARGLTIYDEKCIEK